jgi:hypothetical protein
VVKVVDDEQEATAAKLLDRRLEGRPPAREGCTDGLGDRGWDIVGVRDAGEVRDGDTAGLFPGKAAGQLQCEPRLSNARSAGHGDQPSAADEPVQLVELTPATDELVSGRGNLGKPW